MPDLLPAVAGAQLQATARALLCAHRHEAGVACCGCSAGLPLQEEQVSGSWEVVRACSMRRMAAGGMAAGGLGLEDQDRLLGQQAACTRVAADGWKYSSTEAGQIEGTAR